MGNGELIRFAIDNVDLGIARGPPCRSKHRASRLCIRSSRTSSICLGCYCRAAARRHGAVSLHEDPRPRARPRRHQDAVLVVLGEAEFDALYNGAAYKKLKAKYDAAGNANVVQESGDGHALSTAMRAVGRALVCSFDRRRRLCGRRLCSAARHDGRAGMRAGFAASLGGVYLHAFVASTALLLGPLQLSAGFRRDHARIHRWLGALSASACSSAVSRLCLAQFAHGGLAAGSARRARAGLAVHGRIFAIRSGAGRSTAAG